MRRQVITAVLVTAGVHAVWAADAPTKHAGSGSKPGLWSTATTVAVIKSRWLDDEDYKKLEETQDPDELLRAFRAEQANLIVAIALQDVAIERFIDAKTRVGEAIAIPEKNLTLTYEVVAKKTKDGHASHQAVYTFRVTRVVMPPPPTK